MIVTRLTAVYVCTLANVLWLLLDNDVVAKFGYIALCAAVTTDLFRERRAERVTQANGDRR